MTKRVLRGIPLLAVVLVLGACGGGGRNNAPDGAPSQAVTATPASASTPTSAAGTPVRSAAVAAAEDLVTTAREYQTGFNAWISGGSGQHAAAAARNAATNARRLQEAAIADGPKPGAVVIATAAGDYVAFFNRASVLTGEGETAYKNSEATDGDIDCFKARAFERWQASAATYLGAAFATPPIGKEGVCDAGYGSS